MSRISRLLSKRIFLNHDILYHRTNPSPINVLFKRIQHKKRKARYLERKTAKNAKNKEIQEIYTDASIRNSKIGLGIWTKTHSMRMNIVGLKDVNRAEIAAIFCVLLYLYRQGKNHDIIIYTDSIVALECIQGSVYCEKFMVLIRCIHHMLDNWNGSVKFQKVKGHSGNKGNDFADLLARESTELKGDKYNQILPDNIIYLSHKIQNECEIQRLIDMVYFNSSCITLN